MKVGLLGGTGKEGRGLAVGWSRASHDVVIGSRDAERARACAAELGGGRIVGGDYAAACDAEVIVICVPYQAHADTLRPLASALAGRIVVDLVVPLVPPTVTQVRLPAGGAAALEARELLPGARVVATLHHVSAAHLADAARAIDSDVLTCGDDAEAKERVLALISDLGMRGVDAGPLANAVALEALTPVLLYMGKRYKRPGLGVRIAGLET